MKNDLTTTDFPSIDHSALTGVTGGAGGEYTNGYGDLSAAGATGTPEEAKKAMDNALGRQSPTSGPERVNNFLYGGPPMKPEDRAALISGYEETHGQQSPH
jgi:hypothetical protein